MLLDREELLAALRLLDEELGTVGVRVPPIHAGWVI
jgi:hypothetical protein